MTNRIAVVAGRPCLWSGRCRRAVCAGRASAEIVLARAAGVSAALRFVQFLARNPAIRDWLFLHFGQGGTAAILIGGTLLCLRRLMK
ncbi:Uncharacterised protein [Escherichia coli]|uniref:Uncharacterized protein n=1 Tax=Escherichia coli TaxID=562 RepID=A0A377BDQ6_ECOLX|nr:Uncharacterised protein [Escherichia coli]